MPCLINYVRRELSFFGGQGGFNFSPFEHVQPKVGVIYTIRSSNQTEEQSIFQKRKKLVLHNIKPIWSKRGRHGCSTGPLSLSPPANSRSCLATPLKTKPSVIANGGEKSTGTQNVSFNYFCISAPRVDPLFGAAPLPEPHFNTPPLARALRERGGTGEIKAIRDDKSDAPESSLKGPNAGNYHQIRPPASFSLLITAHDGAWTL